MVTRDRRWLPRASASRPQRQDGHALRRSTSIPTKTNPMATLPWFMLWAAYKWTGDQKYLVPFGDDPPVTSRYGSSTPMRSTCSTCAIPGASNCLADLCPRPQGRSGHGERNTTCIFSVADSPAIRRNLEKLYASQIETAGETGSSSTPKAACGSTASTSTTAELQRARLGRRRARCATTIYPGNVVSWKFEAPANEKSVGILVPEGTPDHIKSSPTTSTENPSPRT